MTDVNIEEMDFETFLKNNVELESFDAKAVLLADRKQMLEEMQRQAEQEAMNKRDDIGVEHVADPQTQQPVARPQIKPIEYGNIEIPQKLSILPSPLHGNGVYSKEPIQEGELVEKCRMFRLGWRMNYQKDPVVERYAIADTQCKCRDCIVHGPSLFIPLGYGSLYNHNSTSNIRAEYDFANLTMSIYATENIASETELLFEMDSTNWPRLTSGG